MTLQQQQQHYDGREAVHQQHREQYSGGRQAVQWALSPPSPSDWIRGIGQGQQGYSDHRQGEAVPQLQKYSDHQAVHHQHIDHQAVQSEWMQQPQQRQKEEDMLLLQGAAAGWEGSTRVASVLHLAAAAAARPKYPKAWSGDFGHLTAEPRCGGGQRVEEGRGAS